METELTLTPVVARSELNMKTPLDRVLTGKVGEQLVSGTYSSAYDVYAPQEKIIIPSPYGISPKPLRTDLGWKVSFRLDDGSLVIEAPPSFSSRKFHLGLRVDSSGQVVGERPWFDLDIRATIDQPSWGEVSRKVFFRSGTYQTDAISFIVRYEGVKGCKDGKGGKDVKGWEGYEGCVGIFDYFESKAFAMKSEERIRSIMDAEDKIRMWGLEISFREIAPDYVTYTVKVHR